MLLLVTSPVAIGTSADEGGARSLRLRLAQQLAVVVNCVSDRNPEALVGEGKTAHDLRGFRRGIDMRPAQVADPPVAVKETAFVRDHFGLFRAAGWVGRPLW